MVFMRLCTLALASLIGLCVLRAQVVPAQATKPQGPAASSTQRNPFEAVPESPQFTAPKISGPIIEAIEFRGVKRATQSVLRAIIVSRAGGAYDTETLRRDSQALYNTGRFSDVVWETEPGPAGPIVRFALVERPLVQSIEYQGDTVTTQEILERFQQRKVKLRTETLFQGDDLLRAVATVQELLAEKGRPNSRVTTLVEQTESPSIVKIIFRVEEKQ